MIDNEFTITAPARLHFGLFSVTSDDALRFGGMGMMVKTPATRIRIEPAKRLTISGSQNELIRKLVGRWFQSFGNLIQRYSRTEDLPLHFCLEQIPQRHSGFGSGTQIAFSISALLSQAFGIPLSSASEIATVMGRGRRSAIGSHGFLNGGVLVDRGVSKIQPISPLEIRVDFPEPWRVVLLTPLDSVGVHGALENTTFDELTHLVPTNRDRLVQLCKHNIVPAIYQKDYSSLGRPLHEFNRLSGEYFSAYQFGCYHSSECQQIVNDVLDYGISAVGQSSWGPGIFSIVECEEQAEQLVRHLKQRRPAIYTADKILIQIAQANNDGAKIHRVGKRNQRPCPTTRI